MNPVRSGIVVTTILALMAPAAGRAEDKVATAVYAKIEKDYKREKARDGSFKPEYYALSNGGRVYGTASDITVDRVTYPQVANIAMRLLAQQNYHYAQAKEQAQLLIMLQWGSTIGTNGANTGHAVAESGAAFEALQGLFRAQGVEKTTIGGSSPEGGLSELDIAKERFESAMHRVLTDDRLRDQLNERNARVLGYLDDLADSNDIRRWAGGGDRFTDLIGDVEESRYYIVVSAYDFPELLKTKKQKLLWQTRVSVRSPGNTFDDSFIAMLKTAAPYFGRESGKLVHREESKGTVELGDLKFLGEAKEAPTAGQEPKKSGQKE